MTYVYRAYRMQFYPDNYIFDTTKWISQNHIQYIDVNYFNAYNTTSWEQEEAPASRLS